MELYQPVVEGLDPTITISQLAVVRLATGPSTHANWDGIHLTEAAYRLIADSFLKAKSVMWTESMRDEAMEELNFKQNINLKVVDVGGGTGFTTLGVVRHVKPENVIVLDQSPHQLAKAKERIELKGVTFLEGNAEDLPFPNDFADRYVSAGSIEYWPDPQRGIAEAYRVVKKDGIACIIGPVYPTFWLSKFFADLWMLFPREEEYFEWFKKAGFVDVKLKRTGPSWYRGVRRHGLVIGCVVTGTKPSHGPSPLHVTAKMDESKTEEQNVGIIEFIIRFVVGYIASGYFMLVPAYMWIKNKIVPHGMQI